MKCYIFLFLILLFNSVASLLQKDRMYVVVGEQIFTINVIENLITEKLLTILPLKGKIIKNNKTRMEISFRAKIETMGLYQEESESIEVNKGDLFLFQGKELIFFNQASILINDNGDYIKVGNCENVEELIKITEKNNFIFLWNTLNSENGKGKVDPYEKYNSIMNYLTWKIFTFFCFLLL